MAPFDSLDKDLLSLRIDKERKGGHEHRARSPWRVVRYGLVLLIGAVGAWLGWQFWASGQPRVVEVVSVPVVAARETVPAVLTAGGYIIPRRKIQLSAKVTGRVAAVAVEKGDQVQRGQVLVQLEDTEFRAQVAEARGNLHMAQARLQELLAGSRSQEIDQAQASVELAQANWRNAKLNYERAQQLLPKGLIAQGDYDRAQMTYEVSQAQVTEAKKRSELVKVGPRREQIAFAQAQVEAAQAAVMRSATFLEATEIKAPTDGTILERLVEVGETVTTAFVGERGAKSSVVSLADLQDLQVELDISQADFNKLSMGQKASVVPEAYTDRTYEGQLAEIAPEANRQKATVQVKVKILNPDTYLRPEMNAKVAFLQPGVSPQAASTSGASTTPRPTLPRAAILRQGATAQVWIVQHGTAVARQITLGQDTSQGIEVLEGLTGGEKVIVRDVEHLQAGMAVRLK